MNTNLLKHHIHRYIKTQSEKTGSSPDDLEERRQRIAYFQSYTREKILTMTEEDFSEYLSKLWAMVIWGNKQYVADKIIADNGFDVVRKKLADLLWGKGSTESRWDAFRKETKGFGPAMISELLCHVYPDECMIWNKKALIAFRYLGIPELPKYEYQITGDKYRELCGYAKEIMSVMKEEGIKDPNLLTVNYFLWDELQITHIAEETKDAETAEAAEKEPPEINEFKHNDIRDKIAEIGTFLGFDTRTEQKVADGSKVDTVWEMKVGNMGRILYVFEVQTKGSIDSLIVNLLKALNNPAVQGVVAVSDKAQLEKIRKHSADVANLGGKLKFWDYEEVMRVYDSLASVNETINRLGLVPDGF